MLVEQIEDFLERHGDLVEAKGKTYKASRVEIFKHLGSKGWDLSSPTLKVLHATSPDGGLKLWFKAQAVYHSAGRGTSLRNARTVSYDLDLRRYDGPKFLRLIDQFRNAGHLD